MTDFLMAMGLAETKHGNASAEHGPQGTSLLGTECMHFPQPLARQGAVVILCRPWIENAKQLQ